jgi:hypothetical protein
MRMNSLLMVTNSWTQLIGKRRTTAKARKGMKRWQNKMVLTLALTCVLSPGERMVASMFSSSSMERPTNPACGFSKTQRTIHSLRGERAGVREVVNKLQRNGDTAQSKARQG